MLQVVVGVWLCVMLSAGVKLADAEPLGELNIVFVTEVLAKSVEVRVGLALGLSLVLVDWVKDGLGVRVEDGVGLNVLLNEGDRVDEDVIEDEVESVKVTDGVGTADVDSEGVAVGLKVGVGVDVGVRLGDRLGLVVNVGLAETDGEGVKVKRMLGLDVGDKLQVGVKVCLSVGV
eukprot:NODE_3722_length_913_cov_11.708651_g3570_i0.p2 GENE.NODE_3722_length_913_cov_11.708651_g3570_i0~~NODE_3722_length_913_cov_11.708651_g3570_i0.p2  ORF type:complete len:175 (+),score=29.74 NODE_3722_length_913_cov_11.708651_g3570_i0:350-874(+)